MKNIKLLFLISGMMVLFACTPASEKAEGTYSGTYTPTGGSPTGATLTISKVDESHVNLVLSTGSNVAANNVPITLSGDKVMFNYSNPSQTMLTVTSITGNINNKVATLNFVISLGGTNTMSGAFSGSKP